MHELLATLRLHQRLPAARLIAELGVSRPTLMRAVRGAGDAVLTIGRARRSSYAARRLLRGSAAPLPLFAVSRDGSAAQLGQLHLAHPDGCLLELTADCGFPLEAGDMRDGWFDGLPYFLQDLRPEGFLGRAFARAHGPLLQLSDDPRDWSDDDALHALSLLGSDASGHFIIGAAACRAWLAALQQPPPAIADADVATAYPQLAQQALEHGPPGSSAAGEFPKFTALRAAADIDTAPRRVIVKFCGDDATPHTQRWADLLVCEQIAAACVATLPGLAAPACALHRAGGRTFLEVPRFDRHGAHGRSPLCSWAAINNAWFGLAGTPWPEGAARLLAQGLIDSATRDAVARLWHFGQLIANTDMHDGNLSFVPAAAGGFALAPVYDMLPMAYAPQRGVELAERGFTPRLPLPNEQETWRQAAIAATTFWDRAGADARISAGFRAICVRNAQQLKAACSVRPGPS